ncbi:MAG: aminotransferase class IV [Salinibacterium sp.]|nr:aminotransferase class IV [Salinibacterium sp.]
MLRSTSLVLLNQPSRDAAAHDPLAPPHRVVDVGAPQVSVLDLAATRGDGIFETISIGHGHPQALDHHLRRFASSAATLEMLRPDPAVWRSAIVAAIAEVDPVAESFVKIVMTRGIEGDGRPTGWAYCAHSPDYTTERTVGVRVVFLDRGLRHDVATTSPWLLAGAKTLSYAVNRAAAREAIRRGADDVIFVSSDGFVLEGPTSTVLYRRGMTLLTPGPGLGILDGTTQASIFAWAPQQGFETQYELPTPEMLKRADAAWLVSSVRLVAPIRALEESALPLDRELTERLNAHLLAQRS